MIRSKNKANFEEFSDQVFLILGILTLAFCVAKTYFIPLPQQPLLPLRVLCTLSPTLLLSPRRVLNFRYHYKMIHIEDFASISKKLNGSIPRNP